VCFYIVLYIALCVLYWFVYILCIVFSYRFV
jgi:hypothetical protein